MMEVSNPARMAAAVVAAFACLTFMCSGTAFAGSLEPSAPPGPTMKTLDEIPPTWSQILPASTRFVLVMGGVAVLDKETGLVWQQSPTATTFAWESAHNFCNQLIAGGRLGWRLPTLQELASLLDPSVAFPDPKLPNGHPFSNVQLSVYWSATTYAGDTSSARFVRFDSAFVGFGDKSSSFSVWCVRGGHGVDPQ